MRALSPSLMGADELRQLSHQAHILGRYAECLANERALRDAGFDRNADKAKADADKLRKQLPDWWIRS